MKNLDCLDTASTFLHAMNNGGVFLTAGSFEDANTMTIGWGSVELMWNKGVLLIAVRPQRFTYPLITREGTFTVSVPTKADLKKELTYCGTKSGRDGDKWAATGLTKAKAQVLDTPIVAQCGIHYECKIIASQTFEPMLLSDEVKDRFYVGHDYHTKFYGEIIACYSTDE